MKNVTVELPYLLTFSLNAMLTVSISEMRLILERGASPAHAEVLERNCREYQQVIDAVNLGRENMHGADEVSEIRKTLDEAIREHDQRAAMPLPNRQGW
jgi:hypothetical protein